MVTLKPSIPQLTAATVLLCAGLYFTLQRPSADSVVEIKSDARVFRLSDRSLQSSLEADISEMPAISSASDTKSQRVSSADAAPNRVIAQDSPSPENLAAQDESVSILASGKKASVVSLRSRLLLEAAERGLHSEAPWSDLSVVALGFKRAGDDESALYWFARAAGLASDPDDPTQSAQAMQEVANSLISGNYLDQARKLISRIPDSRIQDRASSNLVRAYARGKKFEAARSLAHSLSHPKAVGQAYRGIAEAEARSLGLADARMTLRLIKDPAIRDDAFGRVAAICAGAGDASGAMALIHEIRGQRARDQALARLGSAGAGSIKSLAALIRDPFFRDQALRKMVSSELDRRRFKTAEHAAYKIKNATQRAKAYEALVQLQIRHRDLDGALARAQTIKISSVRNRSLQAIAVAQVSTQGVKAARKTNNLIGDSALRETTLRKIASRASVKGMSRQAVETIHHIGDPNERALAYASVALTQANYGDDKGARRLAQDAGRELPDVTSPREIAKTVGIIAEVHAQTGDANAAFQAAASIGNSGMRDSTYQKIAMRFAKSHETDLAEKSAQLIERDLTRERVLDSVAVTLARSVSAADAMAMVGRFDARRQQVRFLVAVAARS